MAKTDTGPAPQVAVARAPASPIPPPPAATVTSPPPVTSQAASTATPPPVTAPQPSTESVPRAPADPRPEIERVVAGYARAIESTSIAEIKKSYAGLTAQQQQQWEGFFKAVRNFKPHLTIDRLDVTGASADAGINAVYDYENKTNGQSEHRALHFQATLTREAGGWRIATVR